MSNNEDIPVNQVLETVTGTIRSLVDLVDTAVASIKNHNETLNGLIKINQEQDGKIRTLQSQVYALREDLTLVTGGLNNHINNRYPHSRTNA